MNINEYQIQANKTKQQPKTDTPNPTLYLLGLAGESGELLSAYKRYLRDGDSAKVHQGRVCEELGDLLWYIAAVADEFDIPLADVATKNLIKCEERFADRAKEPYRFDAKYPESEQFPRQLTVVLKNITEDGKTKLRMLLDGKQPLGDDLTDNAYEDDGYRFHDVFHLVCLTLLGWSPVLRKLLERKRRSNDKVNEVEDGGRAAVIEEGISAYVFSYAIDRDHLVNISTVDYEVLRTIKGMTRHLEVHQCSPKDWSDVILKTYEIWRQLIERKDGTIHSDLDTRKIVFVPEN
jgi:NTP pyrophosphatase (non-canonical NTP hydrolase)